MAKCPKCGTELAQYARFCSNCGNDTAAQPANAAPAYRSPSPSPNGQKTGLFVGGGLVALAIIAFFIARAAGLFSGAKAEPVSAGVLSAPQTQVVAAPILNAPPVSTPGPAPVLRAPQMPPPRTNPMPADVIDYLRWLKQFEAGRKGLEAKGQAQALVMMQDMLKEGLTGPADMNLLGGDSSEAPDHKANPAYNPAVFNKIIQDWNAATAIFQQKSPPSVCTTLASNYNESLKASVVQMSGLTNMIQSVLAATKNTSSQSETAIRSARTKAYEEYGTKSTSRSIDQQYSAANDALDAVRSQYTNVPPDIDAAHFVIKSEGSQGIPGLPGLPGM